MGVPRYRVTGANCSAGLQITAPRTLQYMLVLVSFAFCCGRLVETLGFGGRDQGVLVGSTGA